MGRKAVWWVTETLLVWISVIFAFGSLGTLIAPNINPVSWEFGYLLSLFAVPILIVNVAFLLWWLVRRYWSIALISLAGVLMHYPTISGYVNFQNKTNTNSQSAESYLISSFNIHEFRGKDNIPGSASQPLKELIDRNGIDILCFQEFKQVPGFTADTIANNLNLPFYALAGEDGYFYDVAIYSKYPIIDHGIISLNSATRVAQWAQIRMPEGDVFVVNCHLQSTELFATRRLLNEAIKDYDMQKLDAVVQHQVDGLIQSSKVRAEQAQTIVNYCEEIKKPLLLCGDFNSPPNTYAYYLISQKLSDSFAYSENMTEPTYSTMKQDLRIDYVFFNKEIVPLSHKAVQTDMSDHNPVLFQFGLTKHK